MAELTQPYELSDSTPRSSKTTINIAGFHVHLYGVDNLTPEQARNTTVVFHIHGRTRTYRDAEEIAHGWLDRIRTQNGIRKGLVVATFDNRNHGSRAIDNVSTKDWKGGNPNHAKDLLSMIDGIVADVQVVMKHLESYVDGIFFPSEFIVTGLSLGGHATWNILAEDPRVTKAIIVVGSPNLTDLLLDRLDRYTSTADSPAGKKEWPRPVEKLYQARDASVSRISGKTILILNGQDDTFVPSKFTYPWIEERLSNNSVTFFEFNETEHCFSYEMMDMTVEWLLRVLE